jgi:hypothetical protein
MNRVRQAFEPTIRRAFHLYWRWTDTERTHFAARMGAGITDLYMNALGYIWRDNAVCLVSTLDPHADFLYAGGSVSGQGVVLAEARGSFAAGVTDAKIAAEARNKYLRQVRPYIAKPSPHGEVIHGYSLAFGSKPGTTGAFLHLSETQRPKLRRARPAPPQPPAAVGSAAPTHIALCSHRSNFILMDALAVADWIDWTRGARDLPSDTDPVVFFRLEYAGRAFLACANSLSPFRPPLVWMDDLMDHPLLQHRWLRRLPDTPPVLRWFVIEEKAGERFLNALSALIRAEDRHLPDSLDLPSGDLVGLSTDAEASIARRDGGSYDYALFRDGLALLGGPPPRRVAGHRIWHPKRGLE